jgi:hypothetical protein
VFVIALLLVGGLFFIARVRRVFFAEIGRTSKRAWLWRRISRITAGFVVIAVLAAWAWLTFRWLPAERWLTENGLGEPISVFEGISIWPTIALRAFGTLLALFLIWYTVHDLEESARDTLRRFNEREDGRPLGRIWNELRTKQQLSRAAAFRPVIWFPPLKDVGSYQHDDDPREIMPFTQIVSGVSGRWWMRCLRAVLGTTLMMLLVGGTIALIFGVQMFDPARGARAHSLFDWISRFEVFTNLFLTFLVADAAIYSRAFIKRLTKISTRWPDLTLQQYRLRFRLNDPHDLADWIDLRFLAERTRSVTQLVYLPFLTWAVLIFSRSPLLDNFPTPLALVLAQAAGLAVIIGSMLAYRSTAEYARRVSCRHVMNRIVAAKGSGADAIADQLDRLLTEMRELREGAFAPWSSQPIVRAVLLPLLTYGGGVLLHLYALPGI